MESETTTRDTDVYAEDFPLVICEYCARREARWWVWTDPITEPSNDNRFAACDRCKQREQKHQRIVDWTRRWIPRAG